MGLRLCSNSDDYLATLTIISDDYLVTLKYSSD